MPDSPIDRATPTDPAGATRHVLCIDADDDSRLLVAELLYEHEVDFALTADDAIQLAHCRAYDLYLLDPLVPGFADFDLVSELRRYDARVPLVICTSADRARAFDAAAQAVLEKPLDARAVRDTATRLLSCSSANLPNRSPLPVVPAAR